MGIVNKRLNLIEVIYCGYPANRKYLEEYDSKLKGQIEKYKYSPYLAGFYIQNRKLGLKFFISANEDDFLSEGGLKNLSQVVRRVNEIRAILHAKEQSFAGIISGLLYKNKLITETSERDKVVNCVVKGIDETLKLEGYNQNAPIIILGAKGYIGREVARHLHGRTLYLLDINEHEEVSKDWPTEIRNKKAILVNISKKHQIKHYAPLAWRRLILLNEVYPEPGDEEVSMFKQSGGNVYHLSGVKGISFPSFPGAYKNAIPCSASWSNKEIQIVIKSLG